MKDFTTAAFQRLMECLKKSEYKIVTYREFISGEKSGEKSLVLRHDVDDRPMHAMAMAMAENEMQISASYYFRDMPQTFKKGIIVAVSRLGHEVGYHYENMSKHKGDANKAFADFNCSLAKFREIVQVDTICSHGRPLSEYDNLSLWQEHDYKKSGILADVNRDTDFSNILYLTDTGRSWNSKFNRRDKVQSTLKCQAKTTADLIALFNRNELPDKIILNIHPQRWTDNSYTWYRDKLSQSVKNKIKYFFFMQNGNGTDTSK